MHGILHGVEIVYAREGPAQREVTRFPTVTTGLLRERRDCSDSLPPFTEKRMIPSPFTLPRRVRYSASTAILCSVKAS